MIRNRTDKLVEAAFGDRDRADLGTLSAEEIRELAQLEELRATLPRLNKIPEPQISTERLRDAILAQGLKPQPTRSSNSWMWTPAAAFAMAFAIFFLRPKASVEPQITLGAKSMPNAVAQLEFDPHHAVDSIVRTAKEVSAAPVREIAKPTPKRHVKVAMEAKRDVSPNFSGMFASVFQSVATADQVIPEEKPQPVAENSAASNIVLIDQEQNAGAVTPRATEVGNPSNVVVGG